MFCEKCGNEIMDGVNFCTSCGAEVNSDNVVSSEHNPESISGQELLNQSERKKKKPLALYIGLIIVALIVIIALIGNNNPVNFVKNGTFYGHSEQTVGEAFDNFFADPKWESFEQDGYTFVEFTGKCSLYDELTNAEIIFLIEDDEFSIKSCKIGELNITDTSDFDVLLDKIYSE